MIARLVLSVFLVLLFAASAGAYWSVTWQRYKNAHGCQIVPRHGTTPRTYICNGRQCRTPKECEL